MQCVHYCSKCQVHIVGASGSLECAHQEWGPVIIAVTGSLYSIVMKILCPGHSQYEMHIIVAFSDANPQFLMLQSFGSAKKL